MSLALSSGATQQACCYRSALDHQAGYCGDCGKPLFRCMAFEECGGLLDEQGRCNVCVAPELLLDAGAVGDASVGSALTLPLILSNTSSVGRPLFITGLWSRESGQDWKPVKLPWERLNAGQSSPANISTGALERAGTHGIDILLAAATRWRWHEEIFAFTTSFRLTVQADESTDGMNVNITGENIGAGAMINISSRGDARTRNEQISHEPRLLRLTRAEIEERAMGLRGLDAAVWVPRATRFVWKGFGGEDAPAEGPAVTIDGVLALGRTRTKQAGGAGDIRLLVYGSDGALDEEASRAISRHHMDIYVENNRLLLRVNSENGVRINDEAYGRGKSVVLHDGDVIAPLVDAARRLSIKVSFEINHGCVDAVSLTRTPAANAGRLS